MQLRLQLPQKIHSQASVTCQLLRSRRNLPPASSSSQIAKKTWQGDELPRPAPRHAHPWGTSSRRKSTSSAKVKEAQRMLLAETAARPAIPTTVAHRIADEC
eukprot:6461617-Amphidinium_carterae.2